MGQPPLSLAGLNGTTSKTGAGPLASLLNSVGDLQKVTSAVHDLVVVSFVTHPVNKRTEAEVRRRGEYVIEVFRMLRKDHGFSQARAIDTLPHALKAFLNGESWEPPKQRLYRTAG